MSYIRRFQIEFNKKSLVCPYCGKKEYHRCEVNGILIEDNNYGCCWACNSFKQKSKNRGSYAYPTDKYVAEYIYNIPQQSNTILPTTQQTYTINKEEFNFYNNGSEETEHLCQYFNRIGLNYKDTFAKYHIAPMVDFHGYNKVSFWMIDYYGNLCDAKQIAFDKDGHRCKDIDMSWVSKSIAYNEAKKQHYSTNTGHEIKDFIADFENTYSFNKPLFGEHLLKLNKTDPVFVFESEKTAIIVDAYCRMNGNNAICVSVGGKTNFTYNKLKFLIGKKAFVFADTDTYKLVDGKREIETILDNIENKELRMSLHIANWHIVKDDSILHIHTGEEKELCKAKGVDNLIDAKLDLADFILYRLQNENSVPF